MLRSMLSVMKHIERKWQREQQKLRQSKRQKGPMKHQLEKTAAGEEAPRSHSLREKESLIDLVAVQEEKIMLLMIRLDS